MALSSTLEKTRKDIEKKLSDVAPLYLLAGAGDFAVEKLREARDEIATRVEAFDAKALRDHAQATIVARVGSLESDLKAAPEQAKALPGKAQAVVGDALAMATSTALTTYEDLAVRGKDLVTRVRRQQATVELEDQFDATVSKVKAATTTAKKSTAATMKSAKATRTTAKKSATKTRTAAKSATTSAKKTASAAKKAAVETAEKVGD
jgi:heparin binding hemagglutinin HbhA